MFHVDRPQMKIKHATCSVTKGTNTHSEYVIPLDFAS
jgi:hypothetical protein